MNGPCRLAVLGFLLLLVAMVPALPQEPERGENAAPKILGRPASFAARDVEAETFLLEPGMALRAQPSLEQGAEESVDVAIEVPIVDRRDNWVRVLYRSRSYWVALESLLELGAARREQPSSGFRGPDDAPPERLARARELLGGRIQELPLLESRRDGAAGCCAGSVLLTDVDRQGWIERLRTLAVSLVEVYQHRYSLSLPTDQPFVVVVFSDESAYREFARADNQLAGLSESGHARGSLAALYVDKQDFEPMASLFVHEVTHLLNRLALGPELPPWLEEGIAEELASSEVARSGHLLPGTWRRYRRLRTEFGVVAGQQVLLHEITQEGPLLRLSRLTDSLEGREPDLALLLGLPWQAFVEPAGRELRYAESLFFVRFLLEGEEGILRDGFQSYLASRSLLAERIEVPLTDFLASSWPRLQARFGSWLETLPRNESR